MFSKALLRSWQHKLHIFHGLLIPCDINKTDGNLLCIIFYADWGNMRNLFWEVGRWIIMVKSRISCLLILECYVPVFCRNIRFSTNTLTSRSFTTNSKIPIAINLDILVCIENENDFGVDSGVRGACAELIVNVSCYGGMLENIPPNCQISFGFVQVNQVPQ